MNEFFFMYVQGGIYKFTTDNFIPLFFEVIFLQEQILFLLLLLYS